MRLLGRIDFGYKSLPAVLGDWKNYKTDSGQTASVRGFVPGKVTSVDPPAAVLPIWH